MSVELLETAVTALGDVRERVVFLGGATIGLWLTDQASRAPRVTQDVDVVAEVLTLGRYEAFQADLRAQGFTEDTESRVICRWLHRATGLTLDAVPLDASLAGFSGHWLRPATEAHVDVTLPSGAIIRAVPPPYLLATKLEAFDDRGNGDCLRSHDFEDVVLLIDGRSEIEDELAAAPVDLRNYVAGRLAAVAVLPDFEYGVEGALAGPDARDRARAVTTPRMNRLATR